MKKVIYLLMLAMFIGVTTTETFAQKKGNEVVCFKSNMDCENCQKTLTEYLKFEKGVKDLKVDFATNTILVEYKEGKNSVEELAKAVEKKGYIAEKISQEDYKKIVGQTNAHGHEHGKEEHQDLK